MKKMVCEICGSQSIKKENGMFVCQECGTQYSLEEARNLLTELDSELVSISSDKEHFKITSENDKYKLLKKLSIWAKFLEIVEAFEEFKFSTTDLSFWNLSAIEIMNIPSIFPDNVNQLKLNANNLYSYCSYAEKMFAKSYVEKLELKEPDIPFIVKNTYNSIRNDFTIREDNSYFGHSVYKGQLMSDAYRNLYTTTGYADMICRDAQRYTLLEWTTLSLNNHVDDKPCKVYENKIFSNNGYKRTVYDFNSVAKALRDAIDDKGKQYLVDYKNIILPAITERKKEFVMVLSKAKEVESVFDVPVAYRSFSTIVNLMNLIISGKSETWKETIVLYDEEVFRNSLLQKIDELNNTFKQMAIMITNKLDQIGSQISFELRTIDMSLVDLNLKISESNKNLKKISLFAGLTMWNTL